MSPHCKHNQLIGVLERVIVKSYWVCFLTFREGKIKKLSDEALYHFLNGRDTFACSPTGHWKTLIYQIAVLVARTGKVKILPSNVLVVVVSPFKLNALISDQLESCQRLKLKAVKTSQSQQSLALFSGAVLQGGNFWVNIGTVNQLPKLTLEESSWPEALPRWKKLRHLEDSDDE